MGRRDAAMFGDHSRNGESVDVVDVAGSKRASGFDDFIARRENGHPRLRVHLRVRSTECRERANAAGVEDGPRAHDDLAGLDVRALTSDVLAGIGGVKDLHAHCVGGSLFDHDHCIRAIRHRCAGRDLDAFTGANRAQRHLAGEHFLDAGEDNGARGTGVVRIHCPDGISVHRRAGERGHIGGRHGVAREYAAVRGIERDVFGALDWTQRTSNQRPRLVERDRLAERTHLRSHRRSCCTTWPSSGRISLVIARRTASGEPGRTNIALPCALPAVARLIIAAGPICS